jgi:hypothetical protein
MYSQADKISSTKTWSKVNFSISEQRVVFKMSLHRVRQGQRQLDENWLIGLLSRIMIRETKRNDEKRTKHNEISLNNERTALLHGWEMWI